MSVSVVKRSANLSEQIVEAIYNELRAGLISPGERLTEEGTAKRFKVSRTPARDALKELSLQGMLQVREGGGYFVPLPSPEEFREISFVRRLLEPVAVRLAAEEFGAQDIEAICRAISSEEASIGSQDTTTFAQANEAFRDAIFQRVSNKSLRNTIGQFTGYLNLIRSFTFPALDPRKRILILQKQIRDAIQAGDGAKAEALWNEYLDHSEEAFYEAIALWANDGTAK
ncbi:MAG: GntR family transcriptional regulator [Pigmentiphaga sp.]